MLYVEKRSLIEKEEEVIKEALLKKERVKFSEIEVGTAFICPEDSDHEVYLKVHRTLGNPNNVINLYTGIWDEVYDMGMEVIKLPNVKNLIMDKNYVDSTKFDNEVVNICPWFYDWKHAKLIIIPANEKPINTYIDILDVMDDDTYLDIIYELNNFDIYHDKLQSLHNKHIQHDITINTDNLVLFSIEPLEFTEKTGKKLLEDILEGGVIEF